MMMSQNFNRRYSPNRRKTRVQATIEMDGARIPGVIRDVSYEGMKLELPVQIEPGTAITLRFLNQSVFAIVHWSRRNHAGVHLMQRLESKTLIALETAEDDLAEFR